MTVKELQEQLDLVNENAELVSIFVERSEMDEETKRLKYKYEFKFDILGVVTYLRGEYVSMRRAYNDGDISNRPFEKLEQKYAD